jgi:hypothetical protein
MISELHGQVVASTSHKFPLVDRLQISLVWKAFLVTWPKNYESVVPKGSCAPLTGVKLDFYPLVFCIGL